MNIRSVFYTLFLLQFFFACTYRNINVVPVNKNVSFSEKQGIYYILPKTVLTVNVIISETEKFPGPFAQYAEKYLNLSDVLQKNTISFEIKNIELGGYAVPDSNFIFFIELPEKEKNRRNFLFEFNDLGILTAVNIPVKQAVSKKEFRRYEKNQPAGADVFDYSFFTPDIKEKIDTLVEKFLKDSALVEKKTYLKSFIKKSGDDKAREVADDILRLKKYKLELISGGLETAYPENTMKFMVQELDRTIQEYIALFTGTSFSSEKKYHFEILPEQLQVGKLIPVFRFSENFGLLPAGDNRGIPVGLIITGEYTSSLLTDFVNKKDSVIKKNRHGLYYRIPVLSKVIIKEGENIYGENNLSIAQFGVLTSVPSGLSRLKILFNPNSATIRKIGF